MGIVRNLISGKDNQTQDVVRLTLFIFALLLPIVMIWGVVMDTVAWMTGKPFDLQAAFTGVMAYVTGAGAFLTGGGVALWLKKDTEPDGSSRTVEGIATKGTP